MNQRLLSCTRLVAPFAAAVLLLGTAAHADVVPPPATNCPAGSQGSTCHGGPYCSPRKCTDLSACPAGTSCQPVSFCIDRFNCTGGWGTSYADAVVGSCASGSICSKGTCQSLVVCTAERPIGIERQGADRSIIGADRPIIIADRPASPDRPATRADHAVPTAPASDDCGCRMAGTPGGGLAVAGLLVVAFVLGRRRLFRR